MKAKILFTDTTGVAKFKDFSVNYRPVNDRVSLSDVIPAGGFQFRESPPKVFNPWHCTARDSTQWVIVTKGVMRVCLRDGNFEDFRPGEMFLSMDVQPGERFEAHNGHTSQAVGEESLETFFVKVPYLICREILIELGIEAVE